MQLTPTRPAPGTLPGDAMFLDRPAGKPDASKDAVAQVVIQFPMNFGAKVAQDVRMGYRLGMYGTLEDARQGARELAHGRPSIGVIKEQAGGWSVAELLLYDNDVTGIDPKVHRQVDMIMGPDPSRTRVVQTIHQLREPGTRPVLEGVWLRGGNTYVDFDPNGDGRIGFNHA